MKLRHQVVRDNYERRKNTERKVGKVEGEQERTGTELKEM